MTAIRASITVAGALEVAILGVGVLAVAVAAAVEVEGTVGEAVVLSFDV